jgi:Transglycosylase SLT domain
MNLEGVRRGRVAAVLGALALALLGCGHDGNGTSTSGSAGSSTGGGGDGSGGSAGQGPGSASSSGSGTGGSGGGSCGADPLHTGLTAEQTGVSVDAFDCPILAWTAKYHEPDAMIFKAIMYVESRFDDTAVACPNLPCGTPSGWTAAESGCFGLMQVVPACGGLPGNAGLLADGQPNLTTDATAAGWAGSIFNPTINTEVGIAGIAGNRAQVEQQFPGCTEDQYTLMAVGNFNDYGSTTSCTSYNTAYDDAVLMAYQQYAAAAGYAAHDY